jgi:hypothetical protein
MNKVTATRNQGAGALLADRGACRASAGNPFRRPGDTIPSDEIRVLALARRNRVLTGTQDSGGPVPWIQVGIVR